MGPFGDVWSFGITICSLYHGYDERKMVNSIYNMCIKCSPLVDLNLTVQYGMAISIYVSKKFWWILIWQLLKQTVKPPNLIPCQIFWLYGIIILLLIHAVRLQWQFGTQLPNLIPANISEYTVIIMCYSIIILLLCCAGNPRV